MSLFAKHFYYCFQFSFKIFKYFHLLMLCKGIVFDLWFLLMKEEIIISLYLRNCEWLLMLSYGTDIRRAWWDICLQSRSAWYIYLEEFNAKYKQYVNCMFLTFYFCWLLLKSNFTLFSIKRLLSTTYSYANWLCFYIILFIISMLIMIWGSVFSLICILSLARASVVFLFLLNIYDD